MQKENYFPSSLSMCSLHMALTDGPDHLCDTVLTAGGTTASQQRSTTITDSSLSFVIVFNV
ncbi:hypothetical protein [Mandarin fish ranavirus]|nr:hypothetical protein [Mandarin fish ranavirus]WHA35541.1 hypothetical protein MSRaV_53R [Micropterus salmoides ranavirus]WHA35646.1 hypothetical protein SCRaV_53R [Siniperca chuatsi ranavirus]